MHRPRAALQSCIQRRSSSTAAALKPQPRDWTNTAPEPAAPQPNYAKWGLSGNTIEPPLLPRAPIATGTAAPNLSKWNLPKQPKAPAPASVPRSATPKWATPSSRNSPDSSLEQSRSLLGRLTPESRNIRPPGTQFTPQTARGPQQRTPFVSPFAKKVVGSQVERPVSQSQNQVQTTPFVSPFAAKKVVESQVTESSVSRYQNQVEPVNTIRDSAIDYRAAELAPDVDVYLPEQTEYPRKRGLRNLEEAPSSNLRTRRPFKERGSLLDSESGRNTFGERKSSRRPAFKKKKAHALLEKKITADVYIPSVVSVGALAQLLNVKLARLQKKMKYAGMAEEASYDHVLTSDYAVLLAEEFGRKPIVNDEMAFNIYPSPPHPNPSTLPLRPPVVTIMGHVDHGKTTLLDTLRSASVAKGEAGGITQHIGAFSVPVPSDNDGPKTITFLDTPGHAAFSAMRARGASITDIIVLVVAADDGIMPQTKEVISLLKEDSETKLLVAINKVDKPGIDIEDVQKELMAEGIQLDQLGGDVPCVAVSGLTGQGLPDLVETLSVMAEMQDLRAEQEGRAHGYIIESKVQKGFGAVATILVTRGCLKTGAHIISGVSQARVRAMNDASGKPIKAAYPGMAVTLAGWRSLPNAGDDVLEGSESDIKKAISNRERKADIEASLVDVEAINTSRKLERERRAAEAKLVVDGISVDEVPETAEQGPNELNLVIKADVSGSTEALIAALKGIGNEHAMTRILSSGVGDITEFDIQMAANAGGMVVAFAVSVPRVIANLAAQHQVTIIDSKIIYRVIEQVTEQIVLLLPPTYETKTTGEATVLAIFDVTEKGSIKKVAGCRVNNGLILRNKSCRVIRKGITIHEGVLETLKHHKKDVSEVRKGTECGLSVKDFSDVLADDVIQVFDTIETPGVL
ncbi:translation initiation factor IF-2 [Mycena floridula]|nr:translation initiation factor IF-2 [Mycena floridula]